MTNKVTKEVFETVWSDMPARQKESEMYAKKRAQVWKDYDKMSKNYWDKVSKIKS